MPKYVAISINSNDLDDNCLVVKKHTRDNKTQAEVLKIYFIKKWIVLKCLNKLHLDILFELNLFFEGTYSGIPDCKIAEYPSYILSTIQEN